MQIEKEEHWRRRLVELINHLAVKQVAFSDQTGIGASYVSRLLYEPGKKGKKNLGVDTMDAIRRGYRLPPGWFDLPLGADLPAIGSHMTPQIAKVVAPFTVRPHQSEAVLKVWPFYDVKPEQYDLLSGEEKKHIEADILIRIRGRDQPAKQLAPAQN